jgi:hypothetical protein
MARSYEKKVTHKMNAKLKNLQKDRKLTTAETGFETNCHRRGLVPTGPTGRTRWEGRCICAEPWTGSTLSTLLTTPRNSLTHRVLGPTVTAGPETALVASLVQRAAGRDAPKEEES